MSFEIIEAEFDTVLIDPIIPSKGNIKRSDNNDKLLFRCNIYNKNDYWPESIVELTEPFVLGNYTGVTVRANLFRFNGYNNSLIICKKLILRIHNEMTDNVENNDKKKYNDFDSICENMFLNYSQESNNALNKKTYLDVPETGKMLIIVADDYYESMIPLRDWRTRSGHETEMLKCSDLGNTSNDLYSYISTYYYLGYRYVLLVGEGNLTEIPNKSVPYPSGPLGEPKDPLYAIQYPSNIYPSMYISRISAENTSQVENQVTRILKYESMPKDMNWFERACGIATFDKNQNPSDVYYANLLRTDLLNYGYSSVDQLYSLTPSTSITNAINDGRSLVNYIGHGQVGSWKYSQDIFVNSDVDALSNTDKLPFIFSVACLVGKFTDQSITTCFAESWSRAGSKNNPKGAIGFYCSSIEQSIHTPAIAQKEAIELLCSDEKLTLGGLCYNGACKMIEDEPSDGFEMFETWHIFGDAATPLWTKNPCSFNSINISDANSKLSVDVGVTGASVVFASDDNGNQDWEDFVDNSGNQTLFEYNTSYRPYYITVTKHNYIPYIAITGGVIESDEYWLGHMHILDDITISSGNTLTIMDGTTLYFAEDANLIVNGKIIANGNENNKITFKGETGNNWGSVKVYGDNNEFKYCVFDGGDINLYINGSTGNTIDYCEFKNGQSLGMRLYNADADITNSYIWSNYGDGIKLGYASPLFLNNTIEYNAGNGIKAIGYCEPDFVKYDQDGFNKIRVNVLDGLISSYHSDALLGVFTWQSFGKNSLCDNGGYNLKSYSYSDTYAPYNWWGYNPPNQNKFYCDGSSSLNWSNYLSSDPGGGSPLSKINVFQGMGDTLQSITDEAKCLFHLARKSRYSESNKTNALEKFNELIEKYPESEFAVKALLQIYHIYEKNNPEQTLTHLESIIKNGKTSEILGTASELKALKYLSENQYVKAETLCKDMVENGYNVQNKIIAMNILVNLYNNQLKDKDLANTYLEKLEKDYPENIFTLLAQEEMGKKVDWTILKEYSIPKYNADEDSQNIVPDEFSLSQAFPNPFNPSTTLEFALPVQADVNCTIYDLTGAVVKVFDLKLSAGTHSIVWDASNVSSGIYLVRFYAKTGDGSSSFVDYQKVTLLK